ncbi:hypothetical protein BCV69DRAFT_271192 [Microstroma glucosiphilum]|uniref:START domain-containing protein n=1 Tax=Pseudomicrostroma glucosiphilum TaxID=1684307 RepID=A0A316U562_9BASI|nr:hypothetical protein BCV69DRAFT_271192 [Pseudomicrostroma glucosiphilum]PWN19974.1 hypothetical protein BCV69DRAFT_271192 [Pseudomicrostroma glucosiphilum]
MDGINLANAKAQWDDALRAALNSFRLLTSQTDAKSWKPVPPLAQSSSHTGGAIGGQASTSASSVATGSGSATFPRAARERTVTPQASRLFAPSSPLSAPSPKGKAVDRRRASVDLKEFNSSTVPAHEFPPFAPLLADPSSVKVHRRSGGKAVGLPAGVDVYRAVVEVPYEGSPDLDPFRSALTTPEARTKWDRMVDEAETIEMLDPQTRITKTNFKLGWPASPRDAICISRSINDGNTLIDVSTSLKRSADAPAYLRPAPPYVRSHVHLAAWCVQLPEEKQMESEQSRIRVTLYWSWDIKGMWVGMPPGGLGSHSVSLVTGLLSFVRQGSSHLPSLRNYGSTVEILSTSYDTSRDTLSTEYCVLADEGDEIRGASLDSAKPQDALAEAIRAQQRILGSGIEFALPAEEGWDVKVQVRSQHTAEEGDPRRGQGWHTSAERAKQDNGALSNLVTLRVTHSPLPFYEESTRVKISIQRIAASSDIRLRINDENHDVVETGSSAEALVPVPNLEEVGLLNDSASLSGISIASLSSQETPGISNVQPEGRSHKHSESVHQFSSSKRSSAIASIVRRNYIYFTSMLQEPDAKWKHLSDSKGVAVTQLDSIDPTLVVYRAEATFVGVGVWDILASVSSPGTRPYWDKNLEDAKLIEDLGDVSAVWHTKTKAAWPVSPRDTVMVETSYKSPSSVHLFSFSTDDRGLFPTIPAPVNGTIRTQVDLRGWSIESLSPTTVHVTLIEQSDPKGWTSKSATPTMMTNAVAGVGEYAIKVGAPPLLTRLLGATLTDSKYDHEKGFYRLEYCQDPEQANEASQNVECELRCDIEGWSQNLDLVVDPPPINVSCLRRHRLSPGGGGLWLTIEHVPESLEDDIAKVTVRKGGPGGNNGAPKERGTVIVNGARMKVDVDELKEGEAAQLKEKKRSKPQRIPLDLLAGGRSGAVGGAGSAGRRGSASVNSLDDYPASIPSRVGTPTPLEDKGTSAPATGTPFSDKQPKFPMTPALDVLFLLRRIYAERSPDPAVTPAGWALVSHRNGLYVRRKVMASISPTVAVQRGDKVVQGLTAEDLVTAVSSLGCRKQWDDRVESTRFLESYGNGVTSSFITSTGAFPFRGRGFYLASLTAKALPTVLPTSSTSSSSVHSQGVYYHASASFPEQTSRFSPSQLNSAGYPIGKVLVDGWIFETLDPYSSTLNYQIPSTRCTHIVAIDYAGSLPAAVNTIWNSNLPRSILSVEAFLKGRGAVPAVRSPPAFLQVLGDGRDEDHDYTWVVEDEKSSEASPSQPQATLLFNNFSPTAKRLEVLVLVSATKTIKSESSNGSTTPNPPVTPSKASSKKPTAALLSSPAAARPTVTDHDPMTPLKPTALTSDQMSLARKASSSSLRSSATVKTPTPSTYRVPRISMNKKGQQSRPTLIADVEIELKHYMSGYKIEIFSEFGAEVGKEKKIIEEKADTGSRVSSLNVAAKAKKDLPIETTVYDLPPSAVLAATLDPSARPRRHLLRLSLPTESEAETKGDGGTERADSSWLKQMKERGATIRVVVRPVRSEASSIGVEVQATATAPLTDEQKAELKREAEEMDSQSVPVHLGGQKLEVVHVNQTSAMLQRESEIGSGLTRLRRLPRRNAASSAAGETVKAEDQIPPTLAQPIAAALELKEPPAPPPEAAKPAAVAPVASAPVQVGASSKASTASSKEPSKPSSEKEAAASSTQKKEPITASSATAHLMGLLQSYPLSRLNPSTAVSTVSANGEAGLRQRNGDATGPVDKGKASAQGTGEGADAAGQGSAEAARLGANAPRILGGRLFHEARYSLATLLLVAIICFLAGSLIRAMLSPADFIFYPSKGSLTLPQSDQPDAQGLKPLTSHAAGAAAAEIQRMLGQHHHDHGSIGLPMGADGGGVSGPGGSVASGGAAIAWRRMLRLVEIKRAIAGRFDLVLAVVDRRL